jgi:four helix bundle protein
MNEVELKIRTKKFAHDCVKLAVSLPKSKLGNHIEGQLIKCATSVAANYRAACVAQTKKSFIAKISIVVEEADESNFWIEFIIDEKLILDDEVKRLFKESEELTLIFIASRKTAEKSTNN